MGRHYNSCKVLEKIRRLAFFPYKATGVFFFIFHLNLSEPTHQTPTVAGKLSVSVSQNYTPVKHFVVVVQYEVKNDFVVWMDCVSV